MVKRSIHFYAKQLNRNDKDTREEFLNMIKFGMGNTLITSIDRYYEYRGPENVNEQVLTIGGYKSAWLADLVASYILDSTK